MDQAPNPAAGIAPFGRSPCKHHQGTIEGLEGHLGGVVVGGFAVVHVGHPLVVTDPLEPVGYAAELAQGSLHLAAAEAGLEASGRGEEHVLSVVDTGHGQGIGGH